MDTTLNQKIRPSKSKNKIIKPIFYAVLALIILALIFIALVKTGILKAKPEYKYCGCASSAEINCCTEMDEKGECQKSPCSNGCIGMKNNANCMP